MPGPKPLPAEVKRRRGTLRADRTPVSIAVLPPAASGPIADPPAHLAEAGAWLWRHAMREGAAWISASDTVTLRLACEAMDRRAELIARLQSDGYTLYTDKGYAYQHPAAGALATTEKQITTWLSSLGLNTADRGQMGTAQVKARSKLEELRARYEARGPANG